MQCGIIGSLRGGRGGGEGRGEGEGGKGEGKNGQDESRRYFVLEN